MRPHGLLLLLLLPLLLLLLSATCGTASGVVSASSSSYGGYGRNLQPASALSLSASWMKLLDNATYIFLDLSIPGTHNSGSYKFPDGHIGQCQTATILRQLEAGIRFLDLRLACMNGKLRVANTPLSTASNTVLFQAAMRDVTSFLSANPHEVVIVRLSREATTQIDVLKTWDEQYPWVNSVAAAAFTDSFPDPTYLDNACLTLACALGPSRGKIIFLSDDPVFSSFNAISYNMTLTYRQEQMDFSSRTYQYTKWTKARMTLEYASKPNALTQNSVINYFAGVQDFAAYESVPMTSQELSQAITDVMKGKTTYAHLQAKMDLYNSVLPYHVASGQIDYPEKGILRGRGREESVLTSASSIIEKDFPRVNCTRCGEDTACRVAYQGMNRLLLAWLRAGMRGEQQSFDSNFVLPQHLGILVMDFPDNAVIDAIVAVNFHITPSRSSIVEDPKTYVAKQRFCPAGVAGDALVQTMNRGPVRASTVVVGDSFCRGAPGSPNSRDSAAESCDVLATIVSDASGFFTTYNSIAGNTLVAPGSNSKCLQSIPIFSTTADPAGPSGDTDSTEWNGAAPAASVALALQLLCLTFLVVILT